MTSKNLFINLQKEDFKKRIWLIVLSVIGAFLLRPIALLMEIESLKRSLSYAIEAEKLVQKFYSPTNISCSVGVVLLAIFLGISSYTYLFNKKKTDFYHSIPLKREKMFFAYYLNGIYIYLSLYLITQVVCLVITGVQGLLTAGIWIEIGKAFFVQGIYFLFTYHTVILAVMLTGHLAVAVAGSGILLFYAPVIIQTVYGYSNMYFQTHYVTNYNIFPGSRLAVLSPIHAYGRYINLAGEYGMRSGRETTALLIESLIVALILLGISVWLYRRRPSEMAEKAMAFRKTERIICILLVIPAALLGAGFFSSIADNKDTGWFWFGLFFTGILAHATIEIIFQFDFKAGLQHKLQLLLCVVAAGLIAVCFQQDVFGYDRFLPSQDQIESTAVSFTNIDSDRYDFQIKLIGGKLVEDFNGDTDDLRQLENTKLTDISSTIALANLGIADVQMERNPKKEEDFYEDTDQILTYVIRYNMKNHKTIYRSYKAKVEDAYDYVDAIYKSPEYKAHESLLTEIVNTDISLIQKIAIYDGKHTQVLDINKEFIPELLKTYVKELSEVTIEDIQQQREILQIAPLVNTDRLYLQSLNGYYIYPSFTKTIALLKKLGLPEDSIEEKVDVNKIKKIRASASLKEDLSYDPYRNMNQDVYQEVVYLKETDLKKIQELGAVLVPAAFSWNNYALRPSEEDITFDVTYEKENGGDTSISMVVPKGACPEFLLEDFKTQ